MKDLDCMYKEHLHLMTILDSSISKNDRRKRMYRNQIPAWTFHVSSLCGFSISGFMGSGAKNKKEKLRINHKKRHWNV